MASSGVSYHVGRESTKTYDEKWNGVQTGVLHHQHWFWENISPWITPEDSTSGLLPKISPEPPGEYGTEAQFIHLTFNGALINEGDNVNQGEIIGLSGNTG